MSLSLPPLDSTAEAVILSLAWDKFLSTFQSVRALGIAISLCLLFHRHQQYQQQY